MSPVRPIARIRLPRSAFAYAVRVAAVAVWLAACSDPSAPAGLNVTAVDPTNGQIGVVRSRAAAAAQRAGRSPMGSPGPG